MVTATFTNATFHPKDVNNRGYKVKTAEEEKQCLKNLIVEMSNIIKENNLISHYDIDVNSFGALCDKHDMHAFSNIERKFAFILVNLKQDIEPQLTDSVLTKMLDIWHSSMRITKSDYYKERGKSSGTPKDYKLMEQCLDMIDAKIKDVNDELKELKGKVEKCQTPYLSFHNGELVISYKAFSLIEDNGTLKAVTYDMLAKRHLLLIKKLEEVHNKIYACIKEKGYGNTMGI